MIERSVSIYKSSLSIYESSLSIYESSASVIEKGDRTIRKLDPMNNWFLEFLEIAGVGYILIRIMSVGGQDFHGNAQVCSEDILQA